MASRLGKADCATGLRNGQRRGGGCPGGRVLEAAALRQCSGQRTVERIAGADGVDRFDVRRRDATKSWHAITWHPRDPRVINTASGPIASQTDTAGRPIGLDSRPFGHARERERLATVRRDHASRREKLPVLPASRQGRHGCWIQDRVHPRFESRAAERGSPSPRESPG